MAQKLREPLLPPDVESLIGQRAQRDVIRALKGDLEQRAKTLDDAVTRVADTPTLPDSATEDPVAKSEREDLKALQDDLRDTVNARGRVLDLIASSLNDPERKLDLDLQNDKLMQDRSTIESDINVARDTLRALAFVNVGYFKERAAKLGSNMGDVKNALNSLRETYPGVPKYQLTPLWLVVIKFFYLSLVPLLLQVVIDFGYVLALIIGVSSIPRGVGPSKPTVSRAIA